MGVRGGEGGMGYAGVQERRLGGGEDMRLEVGMMRVPHALGVSDCVTQPLYSIDTGPLAQGVHISLSALTPFAHIRAIALTALSVEVSHSIVVPTLQEGCCHGGRMQRGFTMM